MTAWSPETLAVAYDERLLDWRLGEAHPTDPVRARLAVELLAERQVPMAVEPITWQLTDELLEVHTTDVAQTLAGLNREWAGTRPDLGVVAAHMFAATVQLAHGIGRGEVRVGFSPQGAKQAMADGGSASPSSTPYSHGRRTCFRNGRGRLRLEVAAHRPDPRLARLAAQQHSTACDR